MTIRSISTVFALAWVSANPEPNILRYYALLSAGWTDADIAAGRYRAAERDPHSASVEISKRKLGEREALCRWCNKPIHDDPDRRETDGQYIYHEDCYRLAGCPVGPLIRENSICMRCGQLVSKSHCTRDKDGVYHVGC